MSEGLRYMSQILADDIKEEYSDNDGFVTTNEAKLGKLFSLYIGNHLINFDADHYEMIGMRPGSNTNVLFDFYANTIKMNHPSFKQTRDENEVIDSTSNKRIGRKTAINVKRNLI